MQLKTIEQLFLINPARELNIRGSSKLLHKKASLSSIKRPTLPDKFKRAFKEKLLD